MQAARSSQHSENRALHQNGHARMTTRDSLMQSSSSLATMENPRRPQHRRRRPLPPGRLLSWETVEPTSADSVDGPSSSIKVFLTVRLPLTSLQIEFCYNSSLGTPSCAMNITHIIDQHSILGDHVFDSMSSLPELQRLLSERKISIYSLVGDLDLFWVGVTSNLYSFWLRKTLMILPVSNEFAMCRNLEISPRTRLREQIPRRVRILASNTRRR